MLSPREAKDLNSILRIKQDLERMTIGSEQAARDIFNAISYLQNAVNEISKKNL